MDFCLADASRSLQVLHAWAHLHPLMKTEMLTRHVTFLSLDLTTQRTRVHINEPLSKSHRSLSFLRIALQCAHNRGSMLQVCVPLPAWGIRAGARETIYFNPAETNVAIVTCGGLCPGLNDVVQGLVRKLEDYGVPEGNILGIRYSSQGPLLAKCAASKSCLS